MASSDSVPSPDREKGYGIKPGTVQNGVPNLAITRKGWRLSSISSRIDDEDVALKLFADPNDPHEPADLAEEARLVRKIDYMILPYLTVCYAFFYLDKTTLSHAALFGIRKDLHLHGTQYNWLSSLFYFGFLAWAIPTNFLMQRLPLGKYVGFNVFMWGFFLMLQAACNSFESLAVLRALAGAAEACTDPSLIGLWYTANGVGIALGGILCYGIGHIKGVLPSWKYELLIIGCLCSAWGIVILIVLPDSPVTAKLLSHHEKRIAVERLRNNQTGCENKHIRPYQVWEAFKDYKIYFFFVLGIVGTIPNGGISNFGTIIIQGFGFSTLVTTLMQIPYGAFISLTVLLCVYLNNKFTNKRCLFIVIFLCPIIAGVFGLHFVDSHHKVDRYICYLLTGPANAAFVMILSLQIANTAGHTKKVVTNAMLFLGYCTGNISGPFFYKDNQSPTYSLGIWSMIVSQLLEVVAISALWFLLAKENKKRDKLQSAQEGGLAGRNLDETAFGDLTDRENPNFRYIY